MPSRAPQSKDRHDGDGRRHPDRPADDARHEEVVFDQPQDDEEGDRGESYRQRNGQCDK
jgi:hypothetical protein